MNWSRQYFHDGNPLELLWNRRSVRPGCIDADHDVSIIIETSSSPDDPFLCGQYGMVAILDVHHLLDDFRVRALTLCGRLVRRASRISLSGRCI